MNTTPTSPVNGRLHPLMILAALAVLLFCMIGTAAIMGWIPSSIGGNANRQLSEADRVALAAALPQGAPQPAPGVVPLAPAQQAGMAQAYAPQPGAAVP